MKIGYGKADRYVDVFEPGRATRASRFPAPPKVTGMESAVAVKTYAEELICNFFGFESMEKLELFVCENETCSWEDMLLPREQWEDPANKKVLESHWYLDAYVALVLYSCCNEAQLARETGNYDLLFKSAAEIGRVLEFIRSRRVSGRKKKKKKPRRLKELIREYASENMSPEELRKEILGWGEISASEAEVFEEDGKISYRLKNGEWKRITPARFLNACRELLVSLKSDV